MAKKLVLFFSYRTTLHDWYENGSIDREKLIYEAFLKKSQFVEIFFLTYGVRDSELRDDLVNCGEIHEAIRVLTPPASMGGRFGQLFYSLVAPLIHWRAIKSSDILKTNQTTGGWSALIARLFFRKPLLYRAGYIWSHNAANRGERVKSRFAHAVEWLLLKCSTAAMVSSQLACDTFRSRVPNADVRLIPTFVDTHQFTAKTDWDASLPVLFVGRLSDVKNVANLIRACASLKVALTVYGDGPLRPELEKLAADLGANVEFAGLVPNRDMPAIHRRHSIYVLCSKSEGMPKSLIEAMASGMICVGTDVSGIHELIEHRVNGYLATGTGTEAIAEVLGTAIAELDPAIGERARQFAVGRYALESVADTEWALMEDCMTNPTKPG